jgi:hypothetical protein
MKELLSDDRGWLVDHEYLHVDPFGDGHRYWINKQKAVQDLIVIYGTSKDIIKNYNDKAREFVLQRDWQIGIDKLDEVLKNL